MKDLYFFLLLQSSVTINNKNISLKDSINQLYNYYPTTKDSFELIYQEIFKEIQKNVCLTLNCTFKESMEKSLALQQLKKVNLFKKFNFKKI